MNPLILPVGAVTRLCEDIGRYGRQSVESGGLLLTERGCQEIKVVALAGSIGITRSYGLFVIARPAFDAIFSWAEDNDLRVRAMVHSHAGRAFLSSTDRDGGLRVRGFVSAVVPTFADPPQDPNRWGWWTFASDWTELPAPPQAEIPIRSVVFDGVGVGDH